MTRFGKRRQGVHRPAHASIGTDSAPPPSCTAAANPPAPSLKPAPSASSPWIASSDLTLLLRALDAADGGEWGQVRSLLSRGSAIPAAQALVRWRLATNGNAGMGFSDLMQAAEEFKGWPDSGLILDQLEADHHRAQP